MTDGLPADLAMSLALAAIATMCASLTD